MRIGKFGAGSVTSLALFLALGCGEAKSDPKSEAPPNSQIEKEQDSSIVTVEHPEQFPLFTVTEHAGVSNLQVTGVVSPDVSRTVPVVSMAAGRVVEVRARLGDRVNKGQVLMRVQSSDIASAFSDYRKAVADETLVRAQYERAKDLHERGAISLNEAQAAEVAENKAKVDVDTTAQRLQILGSPLDHPSGIVDIVAPISGVITDQQVTSAAGVQGLASPNPFTISDLSNVWILCDVYENDLFAVRVGENAEIRVNAYPDIALNGKIGNIGSVLDPSIRTAKVRVEVKNPGLLRVGMFVTANFHGESKQKLAMVPASAILHLHDRDWVYIATGGKKFRRQEVVSGATLPDKMQQIVSGVQAGQKVASNALVLQNTVEQ
jgi:cobalt-zinc-cadmium efflux system membrane fusion protein